MNYTEQQYLDAKHIVKVYEAEKKRLDKFKGKSTCPFCSGSKTKPFVRRGKSQDCKECDDNGKISNRKLAEMELECQIEK